MPSPVIKRASRDGAIVRITSPIQGGAAADGTALTLVQQAYEQAHQMRAQANQEAEHIRTRARAEARAEYEHALAQLAHMVEALRAATARAVGSAEPIVIDLAVEVAARILGQELTARPDHIIELVRGAAARLERESEVTVRVHPEDLAMLETHRTGLEEACGNRLRLIADERVDAGCMVETTSGAIDARLWTQLREVRRVLQETVDG